MLLQQHPGLTAEELAEQLADPRATKAEVNVTLIGSPERFTSVQLPPAGVRWYLRSDAGDPAAGAAPASWRASRTSGSPLQLYQWQQEALSCWRQRGHRGLIAAVTGTGKTQIGLEAAREELRQDGRVLVLVPSRELQDQWYQRLATTIRGYHIGRLGGGHQDSLWQDDILVATVQSACRRSLLPPGQRGLLIADECHRYGAETYQRALDPSFARRLGLTATPKRNDDAHLVYLEPYFGGPPIFHVGYRRAIDDGVVARFKLALIGVPFTASEQQAYDELIETLQDTREQLRLCGVPQDPFGVFMKAVSELADDPTDPACRVARRYLNAFSRRREVLGTARGKTSAVGRLAPAVKRATGTLAFTMTTTHAEQLATALASEGVKAAALHSGMPMRERRSLLDRFGQRRLQALAAPMVLDEGIDVPDADLAIIVAASQTERQMIQRMGRVLRRKPDGRLARIAIIYVANTMEDPARGAHEVFLDTVRSVANDQRQFPPGTSLTSAVTYLNDVTSTTIRPPVAQPADTLTTEQHGHRIFLDRVCGQWSASCSCGWTHPTCYYKKRSAQQAAFSHLRSLSQQ